MIRPPTASELPALRRIERAAGAAFVTVGLPEVAADVPFNAPYHARLGFSVPETTPSERTGGAWRGTSAAKREAWRVHVASAPITSRHHARSASSVARPRRRRAACCTACAEPAATVVPT